MLKIYEEITGEHNKKEKEKKIKLFLFVIKFIKSCENENNDSIR